MRQSGSLTTGTQLWWRWRYTDSGGSEQVSETRSATWMDPEHEWQSLASGKVQLHWYEGGQDFAQDLMNSAKSGLDFNSQNSGLIAEAPIDIYIYSGAEELKNAILYEPAWTGGMAYPDFDIVLIGISPVELEWGRDATRINTCWWGTNILLPGQHTHGSMRIGRIFRRRPRLG
jgi:hypothetical protein